MGWPGESTRLPLVPFLCETIVLIYGPSCILLICSRAAMGRLQAASRRLQAELENEKDLQSKITAMLEDSE